MLRALTYNLGWKAMSLVMAILLWIAVLGESELTSSVLVPIEFRNIPKDLEVSSDVPERLHVEIEGPASRLTPSNLTGAAAVLNLARVQNPGERTFTFGEQNIFLPNGVKLARAIPSQIRLTFEHRRMREVLVQPRFINVPQGYRVARYEIRPDRLKIVGPESRVLRIGAAETDPIDVKGVISESTFQVHTYVPDPQVRFDQTPPVVDVKVWVQKH